MGVSVHSLVRRIPMALGPLLGGAMIGLFGEQNGVRLAFVIALLLAGVSLGLQQAMIEDSRPLTPPLKTNPLQSLALLNPALRNLLVSDILVRFCEQIPYAFVVIWCVTVNGISPFQFGVLTAVEMVTAMLIYIPVAYLADKSTKKPFVVVTFGFFTLFPLILLFSRSFWLMFVAFIIRGLKEFGEPTRKALIMDLAAENKKATTFGIYYLLRDIVVSAAAFGGAFLWLVSPTTNFLGAFSFGLIGTLYFVLFGKDLTTSSET
jgi:MFS family permease